MAVTYSRFPAAVTSERLRERRSAVVVHDGHARVAVIVPKSGVQVVAEFDVVEQRQDGRKMVLVDSTGVEWLVERGDGCGCASPLRSWYTKALGTPARTGT